MIGYINKYRDELRDHLEKMKKKPAPIKFDFESDVEESSNLYSSTIPEISPVDLKGILIDKRK